MKKNKNNQEIEHLREENSRLSEQLNQLKSNSPETFQNSNSIDNLINETDSVSSENSYLKSKINDYTAQIADLKAHLGEILQENKSLKNRLSKCENSNTESCQSQLFVAQTDLETLNEKFSELQNSSKRTKIKCKEYQKQIADLTDAIKSKDKAAETLQMKLEKLQIELDDLRNKNPSSTDESMKVQLAFKDQQIKNLNEALIDLTTQFDEVNKDLSNESQIKNKMVVLVSQQSSALASYGEQINRYIKENNSLKSKLESLQAKINEVPSQTQPKQCNHSEIPETIREFIKENFDETQITEKVKEILISNDLPVQRIKNVIIYLLGNQNVKTEPETINQNDLVQQNKRLTSYLISLTRFVDQISNSAEIQDWLISTDKPKNFSNDLKRQMAKIQSFIEENKIETENLPLAESFASFPTFVDKVLSLDSFADHANNSELVSLLHSFVLSNSVLCKYSNELQQRGRIVVNELKQLKEELSRSNSDKQEEIEQIKSELLLKIDQEKLQKENLEEKIQNIQKLLRNNDETDLAEKCLALIASSQEFNEEEQENYTENLEIKIAKLNEKRKEENEEKENKINELELTIHDQNETIETMKIDYENEKTELVGELETLKIEIEEIKNDLENKEKLIEKIQKENEELNKITEMQKEHITNIDQIKDNEINTQMNAFIDSKMKEIQNLSQQNEDLNLQLQKSDSNHRLILKDLKKAFKEEVNKLRAEVDIQTTRANELRSHYDGLLTDLRSKLNNSRISETQMREKYEKMTAEVTDLKSRLSSLSVEQKMMQIKKQNSDEKLKREKALMESKSQMEMMSLESSYITKLNEAKAECKEEMDKFIIELIHLFSEYKVLGSEDEISQEKAIDFMMSIKDIIKSKDSNIKDLSEKAFVFEKMKKLLGMDSSFSNENVFDKISKIVKEKEEIEQSKTEIIKNKEESKDLLKKCQLKYENAENLNKWEEWAKRIHVLISDNFSVVKNSNELRSCLEDAILSSIGHRQTFRKLQILRIEKDLYKSGLLRAGIPSKKEKQTNLLTLVAVFSSIQRLQKISGHLVLSNFSPSKISSPDSKKSPKEGQRSPTAKKSWPLFQ
ncbi:hypothetical protein TVAG_372900 [Trichomonas vaginalis G3]|uniref:Viral A-type inclusion protein n=1 Tax=Trichomonas vaginalis (strain ATCC PRA-98 / G3) TaxID=412133 RepID=A2DZF3_TRIV3|nr:A-type inclusion protein-related family [Trichomonas vaginalis G3]EAY14157.1 hypothetical protein TVAG_372900 [Trichomonas vaginalis G3]KAI5540698.1 A-type inclusion protein-related family [Trichomonas vaginalis G3]|eukprot:XP_001326380.1 hypothetical protein [Trichomonas vaginalis G3]